jgi:acetyl esterase/lipase
MIHRLNSPVLLICAALLVLAVLIPDARTADGSTRPTDRPVAATTTPVDYHPAGAPAPAPLHIRAARSIDRSGFTPPPPAVTPADEPQLRDVAYGPDPAHRLDIHPPAVSNGLAVLWLHPGGWTSGDRTGMGPIVDQLVANGAVVFSADYRLTPDHAFPAQIHDVKRAIRYVKSRQADFPHRHLVVAGASAGGHLAALAATSAGGLEPVDLPPELAAHDSTVDGAISLSGPMDLTRFWKADHPWAKGLSDAFLDCDGPACDTALMLEASPVGWVDPEDPPLYLAAGTDDSLVTAVDNGDRMWETTRTQGDPSRCWYDRVDGGTHNLWDTLDLTRLQRFLVHFDLVEPGTSAVIV